MKNDQLLLCTTKTGQKEVFTPRDSQAVSLYVCGVTPYAPAHVGHARCYVSFDVLQRVLLWLGYGVRYVQNVTDVDDKIVQKALDEEARLEELQEKAEEIAARYTASFNADMARLNVLPPTVQPRISDNMQSIISFIEQLIAAGHAYSAGGDVYFSVLSHKTYGSLSGRSPDDEACSRVESSPYKRHPADFALWKGGVIGSFWQSPWGAGRPGWHIECSALARQFLGDHIDIHGGGIDLLFPHHENECAQTEALVGMPFARYWLHNAHVTISVQKMSKSLGNTRFIGDICSQYDPMIVRYYLLQHHYRTPLDFDEAAIVSAGKAYTRLVKACNGEGSAPAVSGLPVTALAWQEWRGKFAMLNEMALALFDDLNVPKALGIIFAGLDGIIENKELANAVRLFLQDVCGLTLQPIAPPAEEGIGPEVQSLVEQREQARKNKDWARADELRRELASKGYTPKDGKIGG